MHALCVCPGSGYCRIPANLSREILALAFTLCTTSRRVLPGFARATQSDSDTPVVSTGSLLSVEVFTASIIPQRLWFVVTVTGGLCKCWHIRVAIFKFQRLGPRTLSESRPHAGHSLTLAGTTGTVGPGPRAPPAATS